MPASRLVNRSVRLIGWTIVLSTMSLLWIRRLGSAPNPVQKNSDIEKKDIAAALHSKIRKNEFPTDIELTVRGMKKNFDVNYSIDSDLQNLMTKELSHFRPDYGAFVAMDAMTGRILVLTSFTRRGECENLALRATFPAASIFKIVTATAAMDLGKARPYTVIPFNGGFHTLYKRNVNSYKENRWSQKITLSEAFAKSVNTVFAKLGVFFVGGEHLKEYADRFFFNQTIPTDVPADVAQFNIDETNPWKVAEAASGYNREITLSPLQGGMMASSIANGGVLMEPYLVQSLNGEEGFRYENEPRVLSTVMDSDTAASMRSVMQDTVKRGTSSHVFREFFRKKAMKAVQVGGKTGSLWGNNPKGKYDWFVGWASTPGHRIALAALTINEDKWQVKASYLAREFIENYFKKTRVTTLSARER